MSVLRWRNGNAWKNICDLIFPVGSIHLSQTNASPAGFCGGTWADLNEDRFLLPSAEWATGGSTTIAVTQIPGHTHTGGAHTHGLNNHTHSTPNHTHTWQSENATTGWTGNQTLSSSRAILAGSSQSAGTGMAPDNGLYAMFSTWKMGVTWMASSGGGTTGANNGSTASAGNVATASTGGGKPIGSLSANVGDGIEQLNCFYQPLQKRVA